MTAQPFSSNCTKRTHIIPASYPRNPSTVKHPETRLQLSVDEYIALDAVSGGITLIFTHGTSFNKNLWEPIIGKLLRELSMKKRGCVTRVLAIDATNHGESWVLNEKLLTNVSHWPDQSRDILSVLGHFKTQGSVIGIGHSFGGGIMAHASIMEPAAFLATVFIDPIIFQMKEGTKVMADRALTRIHSWENLEDVRKVFKTSKAFSRWNREVLDLHIEYSTRDSKDGGKTMRVLKTPKEQEAATYLAAPFPQLPECLAASEQTHFFVLGGRSIVTSSEDRQWIQAISKPPGKVIVMEDVGHLIGKIPMTHPDALTSCLSEIISNVSSVRSSL